MELRGERASDIESFYRPPCSTRLEYLQVASAVCELVTEVPSVQRRTRAELFLSQVSRDLLLHPGSEGRSPVNPKDYRFWVQFGPYSQAQQ